MTEWDELRNHLMRGGAYGHYWINHGNKKSTVWWEVGAPAPVPTKGNIYFGVHPVSEIPTLNSLGEPTPPQHVRSRIAIIAAVNCLFAEYDAKDFEGSKEAALDHIRGLNPLPSAVVDSGGGYHAYWLFDEPITIDSDYSRKLWQYYQAAWVDLMGGDDGAKDLARVLRVPGTLNVKPAYAPDYPTVEILHLDPSHVFYAYDLADMVPPMPKPVTSNGHYTAPLNGQKGDGEHWLQKYINQSGGRNQRGVYLATQLRDDGLTQSEAERVMLRYAAAVTGQKADPYPESEALKTLTWAYAQPARRPATSMNKSNFRIVEHGNDKPQSVATNGQHPLLQFEPTDEGNAEAVWSLHSDTYRYVTQWGWLYYTGTHWEREGALEQLGFTIVEVLRERRVQAVKAEYEAMITASKTNTARVNACVAALQKHAFTTVDEFDNELHLLNCRNGVINLTNGHLIAHPDCAAQFTYCIPIEYDPNANYTPWIDFLKQVVGGGDEVIDWLQLAVGYSLTGDTREECLFYIWGPSRSGKGTFTETLGVLLGAPLAVEIDFRTFAANGNNADAQNFALAPLKPSRIVFASESGKYQQLDDQKIKVATGGNNINCAFKGKTHFSYKPMFKLWLSSNERPRGDVDDDAIWGRLRVIEFPNSHLGHEDKSLKQRLKDKEMLISVLTWAVEGAAMWYESSNGLVTPDMVQHATQKSRDELDVVQQWLDECAEENPQGFTSNTGLRLSYEKWCNENGYKPLGAKMMGHTLRKKGYASDKMKRIGGTVHRGWEGFTLIALTDNQTF